MEAGHRYALSAHRFVQEPSSDVIEDKPFSCEHCGKKFNIKSKLAQHIHVHSDENIFPCKICGRKFKHSGSRYAHFINTHGRTDQTKEPLSCMTCGKIFEHSRISKNHIKTHTHERPFECKTCGKFFKSKGHIRAHSRIHTKGEPFSSSTNTRLLNEARDTTQFESSYERNYVVADTKFKNTGMKLLILLVIYELHGEVSSEETTIIPPPVKTLPGFNDLKQYLAGCQSLRTSKNSAPRSSSWSGISSNENPSPHQLDDIPPPEHNLDLCQPGPSSASQAPSYSSVESDKLLVGRSKKQKSREKFVPRYEFACEICGKCFNYKFNLKNHAKVHDDRAMHPCEHCGEKFKSQTYLKTHIIRIHTEDRPFLCEYCGKRFKLKHDLNNHISTHYSHRYFTCELCGKSYKQVQGLTTHQKVHRAVKHFSCDVCGKSFDYKHVMEKHKMLHADERPFRCDRCGKCFKRKDRLKDHERTHINKKLFSCTLCAKSFKTENDWNQHWKIHNEGRTLEEEPGVKNAARHNPDTSSRIRVILEMNNSRSCNRLSEPQDVQHDVIQIMGSSNSEQQESIEATEQDRC
ncbi:hypothetical protein QAD02_005947 [Eretmocerus hayati]|uniref:Uncharacterized protein n=1 Tax=Eretmocerus hayati TaxID=131215 RepID=A0ACC2MZR2_9HYME|nr:hypothetical protein QAD02_005947 [Eretmocerus hayati]